MARDIDGDQFRAVGIALGLAEKHQHPPVGRPCRPLDQKILRQDTFSTTVRFYHADGKSAPIAFREGDQISARRPHRRGVTALAVTDPAEIAAIQAHNVKLLGAAAVGIENDPF